MSHAAHKMYRGLVYENPRFIEFWQTATPLDEIKRMHIGSRPAARGKSSEITKIRAIPWVFSWMQSRFNLPGWFGLGSALVSVKDDSLLHEMYKGWSLFKTMLDNAEMSLIKADMGIASLYVDLVPDKKLAAMVSATERMLQDKLIMWHGKINQHRREEILRAAFHES